MYLESAVISDLLGNKKWELELVKNRNSWTNYYSAQEINYQKLKKSNILLLPRSPT
ncbi:MAG: hypothetical protein F6K54_12980 [Okeania sp. SIO3B5]|uniref:hypothetical protein n=1 Tax=Okeania sp. SIO3B5 TaxID=2607811 RepID=UPI0014013852|nr:hypothetical protein [Okeania sp. SIO3B5]NEO53911.1 hypothetical protein [Okeania sp. SIO3B5]